MKHSEIARVRRPIASDTHQYSAQQAADFVRAIPHHPRGRPVEVAGLLTDQQEVGRFVQWCLTSPEVQAMRRALRAQATKGDGDAQR